eukprot:m.182346 g.182346  ORF g.182346 m.182346 type:complete len:60 (+) comp16884_c1_seq6:1766-1945(+)
MFTYYNFGKHPWIIPQSSSVPACKPSSLTSVIETTLLGARFFLVNDMRLAKDWLRLMYG